MAFKTTVIFILSLATSLSTHALSIHNSRSDFLANVGTSITDDYSSYTNNPGTPLLLSDSEMSAVFSETTYQSLTFSDFNLVGDVTIRGGDTEYCAGCNGNFKLGFESTSLTQGGGVYGVGIDIILHTSRRVSIGDDDPNNPTFPGTIAVELSDNSIIDVVIPADVGYYDSDVYFLGLTSDIGIKSLTIGTEPTASRHFWAIDNLSIATRALVSVEIDIKPNSDANSINLSSSGVIPVAILSTVDFDATTIKSESVSLAGASVKMVGKSDKYLCHQEDIDLDSLNDLVCQVYTAQFMIEEGETTAILEAETTDGLKVRGEDVIRIVPD